MLRGDKYVKPPKKQESTPSVNVPPITQPKMEVPKQAHHVVTTLLAPPSAEDQAAAGASAE